MTKSCSFDDEQIVLMCNKSLVIIVKKGKMLESRRTNKVVLMIDKVKAWCRMCTIMRDCGEEEKVLRQRRKSAEL